MSTATPTKRRAPLGALDVNATRSPSLRSPSKKSTPNVSPIKKSVSSRQPTPLATTPPRKRALDSTNETGSNAPQPAPKKLCSSPVGNDIHEVATDDENPPTVQHEQTQPAPVSPASSSACPGDDTSALINASQVTTITEPDVDAPVFTTTAAPAPALPSDGNALSLRDLLAPPPRPARRTLTREEFRQKAEILKLRLSLATYKVKTNQTDVPLDRLQVRPVPGMTPLAPAARLPSMSAHTVERATPAQYWYRLGGRPRREYELSKTVVLSESEDEGDDEVEPEHADEDDEEGVRLPELDAAAAAAVTTPQRKRFGEFDEERLTSSALRGGAAKGLLSLSQS